MGADRTRLPEKNNREAALKERYRMDLPFLLLTLILVGIGVVMMFSASYARAYQEQQNSTYFFTRQLVFAIVGLVALLLAGRVNYHYWRRFSVILMGIAVVLLILVLLVGSSAGGAKRWLNLGIRFQPSEVAKLAVVVGRE